MMGRDFVIPGVDPGEHDPYRFHTGRKRDHGGEDAIEIIDLVKQFGRARILNGLNLGLPEDQVSMVLGPSGTGKSVLIKHIVGLLYPDSGDVLVHGESIPNMTDDELFEVRKKFGLLFQDGALFGSMNIYDNTAFPLRQHTDKSEEEIGEIVNRRLKEVGLTEATYKMPNELSGGMRKRAGFARALVLEPAIVMFDEPDSGLDPVRTALLCELIREVHAENGGCYLVISHDLDTARRIADFIAVLWNGKIVESGPKEELFDSENQFVASSSTRTSPARSRWIESTRWRAGSAASRRGGPARAGGARGLAVLAVAAGVGATQIPTDAGTGTLVDTDTATYRATQRGARGLRRRTGRRARRGRPAELILTANLFRLLRLEGCLSGKVPRGREADPGPCAELAELEPVEFVSGPATFLNEAVIQIDRPAAAAARRRCRRRGCANSSSPSPPATGSPASPASTTRIRRHRRLRPRAAPAAPRRRASPTSSRTATRPRSSCGCKPDLSDSERQPGARADRGRRRRHDAARGLRGQRQAGAVLRAGGRQLRGLRRAGRRRRAVAGARRTPCWSCFGGRARGHGADPAARLPLAAAAAAARHRPRPPRRSPSACSALFGGSLTMASIAVLPILIGLAVDYAIQFQARFDEAVASGANGRGGGSRMRPRPRRPDDRHRLPRHRRRLPRPAALADPDGPQLRPAARRRRRDRLRPRPHRWLRGPDASAAAGRGELSAGTRRQLAEASGPQPPSGHPPAGAPAGARARAPEAGPRRRRSRWLSSAGASGPRSKPTSDIRELAPQNIQAVRDLNELQDTTGVSGELDVSVEAPDLTDPATIEWMADFKQRVLRANGFSAAKTRAAWRPKSARGRRSRTSSSAAGRRLTAAGDRARRLRRCRPTTCGRSRRSIRRPASSATRRCSRFGIRAQSLEDQQALIDRVRAEIGDAGRARRAAGRGRGASWPGCR